MLLNHVTNYIIILCILLDTNARAGSNSRVAVNYLVDVCNLGVGMVCAGYNHAPAPRISHWDVHVVVKRECK